MNTLFLRMFTRIGLLSALFLAHAFCQVNILTNRYNTLRTAANTNETQLTTANVMTGIFGKLGSYAVDGVIYAQPLYVQGLTVNGATHNVLYVATMHDVLYAFDADSVGSLPLWTLDFRNLAAGITPAPVHVGIGDGTDGGIADTFGILSTPVIDLPNNRMYLVTHTLENSTECFRIREVDIRTGVLLGSQLITGSVPATGSAPSLAFYPPNHGQRAALEIADGQVWVVFNSRPSGDYLTPWYGWVMTYDPNTLAQTSVFATSRTNGNGIWQSGSGPAVDASGDVYYLTGNGGAYDGVTEFPETLLQLSFGSGLQLNNWYTPDTANGDNYYAYLNQYDLDLSVNGPVLIPGTDLITFGSKTGDMYVLHTGNLGQLTPNDTQVSQFFHVGTAYSFPTFYGDRIVGTTYWQSPAGGVLYVWPGLDTLHAYTLNSTTSIFSQSYAGTVNMLGSPGTALAISANGSTSGTGILWAPLPNGSNGIGQSGVLHAYNAENPGQELWNSAQVASDSMGTLAKFTPPVVVNGKVYVANSAFAGDYGAGSVTVFGLKTAASSQVAPAITLTAPTNASTIVSGSSITLSASVTAGSNPVSTVAFMDGTTVLATLTAAPYTYAWTSPVMGTHTITAVATDSTGLVTVATAATITVTGTPTYTLSASPDSLVLPPGGTASTLVTVTPLSGFTGPACVDLAGAPPGVTASITPGPTTRGGPTCATANTFTMKLTAALTSTLKTSTLAFSTGSNGTFQDTLFLPLTISQSALVSGSNTVTFNVPSGITLATPIVFTEGVPSSSLTTPDFTLASSTCTGATTGTCTATIQFTPQYAGLRRGAVKLVDSSNNVLTTSYFFGTGPGTLAPLIPTAQKILYSSGSPSGIALDAAGNLFLVDAATNQLFKVPSGGTPVVVPLGTTLSSPKQLALDAAGNIYIADSGNNRVLELPYGTSTATAVNATGLSLPQGVAVDGAGNLYIANTGTGTVIELAAGTGTQTTVLSLGLSSPTGLAVDAAGNVFIADSGNNRVLEIPSTGLPSSIGSNFANPSAVAVDAAGDVFIADQNHNQLVEVPGTQNGPGTGTQTTVAAGLTAPAGLFIDGLGDVFISSAGSVVEIPTISTQTITFGTIPTQTAGISAILNASASSGLPVSYATTTPAVCAVSGTTASFLSPGTCIIVASQAGNSLYAAATTVSQSFSVVAQTQTISFASISNQSLGTSLALNASATSGLAVTYASTTPTVCTVSGSTASLILTGTCTIVASQSGSNIYSAAPAVPQSFNVLGSGQTIGVGFTVPSGVTLGTPVVFTEGVPSSSLTSPDFALAASGTTCSGSASGTCTVAVQFNPQQAGLRRGAVKLVDSNNNVLATSFISGVGTNAQTSWAAGTTKTIFSSGYPRGVTVDGAGNVFLVDTGSNQVYKVTSAGVRTTVTLGTTLSSPFGLALDAAGDLYIADAGNNRILELPYGSSTASAVNVSGLNFPEGMAIDGSGNLFIANSRIATTNGNGTIIEVAAGSGTQSTIIGSGLSYPGSVALDASGDLFIADWGNNRVLELQAGGATRSIGSGIANASAVAVDALGDVFITDQNHGQLVEVPATASGPGTGTQITLATGLVAPFNLALDGQGDVFIANVGSGATKGSILEIQRAIGINFTVPAGVTLGTPVVFTEGVPSTSLSSPDFVLLASSTTCAAGAAGTCTVAVQFNAQQAGLRRGAVKLVDSNNNVLATAFISGTGPASQTAWTTSASKTIFKSANSYPRGVAVDGAGNTFLLDTSSNQIYKVTSAGTQTLVALGVTLNSPYGLALDAAGNLYIADAGNNRVLQLLYGGSTAVALSISGLNYPEALAVDGAGNIFVANTRFAATSGTGNVIKFSLASGAQSVVAGSGLNYPSGVAVDAAGDVFIADKYNNRVLEIPISGSPVVIGSGLSGASSVAIDGSGNVFITDQSHNQLVLVPGTSAGPGTGTQVTIATGLVTPYAVAVDGQGDAFVANVGSGASVGSILEVLKAGIIVAQTQTIAFGSIASQTLGTSPALTASATSGLTVSFASATPAVCSASGGTATLINSGICTIVASQAGNGAYLAATPVAQSFTVLGSGQTETATFTVPGGVTLGTPIVFTEGVPSSLLASPDFKLGSTNCGGSTTGTCTVSVQFMPQFAGLRRGAVKLVDTNGNLLATSYLSGIGANTLPSWTAGSSTSIYGAGYPRGVAVDGGGNVFVVDSGSSLVFKISPGGFTTTVSLGLTLNSPYGLAIDAAGNLYIADAGNNRIVELAYGSSAATVLSISGLTFPEALAVNGTGTLYIVNTRAAASVGNGNVVKVIPGSNAATTVMGSGLNFPSGVAVDASGDVFIADKYNNRVLEITAGGTQISIGSNLSSASAVAVDAAGDVFIADQNNNRLVEVPATANGPGTGTQTTIATGLLTPYALALDGQGDVFIANVGSGAPAGSILEIPNKSAVVAQAQTITFGKISTQTLGTSLALSASASSSLAVGYTSATPSTCTVSGGTATFVNSGICTIVASQAGSSAYLAATPQVQSFTVVGTGQTLSATFAVPNGVTLGTPIVFTEGVPSSSLTSPDFMLASTTCTGAVSGTCTVGVQFTPRFAGLRRGAVKLVDSNNNPLATAYISGIGPSSATAWTTGSTKAIYTPTKGFPRGVTVDGAGNVFVVDLYSNQIFKVAPGGTPTAVAIGTTMNSPFGLALDAAGNLYIADAGNNRILELPYGSSTATALNLTGLNFPEGVAVDGAGNVFVANTRATTSTGNGTVLKLTTTGVQTTVVGSGLSFPAGMAIDASGDLFVADWGSSRVLELSVTGATKSIGSNIANASGVAVDAAGDVFITDQNHGLLVEVQVSGTQLTILSGLVTPYGLAMDGQGDVFIVSVGGGSTSGSVVEVP